MDIIVSHVSVIVDRTITCILCKILEGCIRDHAYIVEHMVANNTLSKNNLALLKVVQQCYIF